MDCKSLGSSQAWSFVIFTWKRSFAPFCALLRSVADLRLRSFALFCTLLRPFVALHLRSFADLGLRSLRSFASDRFQNDRVWEFQTGNGTEGRWRGRGGFGGCRVVLADVPAVPKFPLNSLSLQCYPRA